MPEDTDSVDLYDFADSFEETGGDEIHVVLPLKGGTKCTLCSKNFNDDDLVCVTPEVWNGVPHASFRHIECKPGLKSDM